MELIFRDTFKEVIRGIGDIRTLQDLKVLFNLIYEQPLYKMKIFSIYTKIHNAINKCDTLTRDNIYDILTSVLLKLKLKNFSLSPIREALVTIYDDIYSGDCFIESKTSRSLVADQRTNDSFYILFILMKLNQEELEIEIKDISNKLKL